MSDAEKFEGFMRQVIAHHEAQYGREIRAKYGDQVVEASYAKVQHMAPGDYAEWMRLQEAVKDALRSAFNTGDPASAAAHRAADLHKQWLSFTWTQYSPEAHRDWLNCTQTMTGFDPTTIRNSLGWQPFCAMPSTSIPHRAHSTGLGLSTARPERRLPPSVLLGARSDLPEFPQGWQ